MSLRVSKYTEENYFMYCELPFYHFYIDGNWTKPCCDNTEIYKSTLDFNNKNLVNFRRKMLTGVKPESCSECFLKEESGVKSYREYNKQINPNPVYDHDNGVMKTKPFTFDIRLDNVCNMKCVMCGPHQSSKWLDDLDIYEEYVDPKVSYKQVKIDRLQNLDLFIDMMRDNAKLLSLLGGEPFQMKSVSTILQSLSDWNRKNTKILITTNANVKNNNPLFNILKEYDDVNFMVSIDGFNKVNDYIRYPSTWNEFLLGLDLLKKHAKIIKFNLTVSALNFPDLDNVQQLADDMNIELILNYLHEPDFLSVNSLKPELITNNEFTKTYKFNSRNNMKMKRYLSALDERRNLDSQKILKWCWI
tara:strand:+ start:555 stop:1634 length:1080 start_codon:yes stop_codon:yes gene_type:complete